MYLHLYVKYTVHVFFVCRDDQDPLYDSRMDHGNTAAAPGSHSNALMNQDWEKDLMEAGEY